MTGFCKGNLLHLRLAEQRCSCFPPCFLFSFLPTSTNSCHFNDYSENIFRDQIHYNLGNHINAGSVQFEFWPRKALWKGRAVKSPIRMKDFRPISSSSRMRSKRNRYCCIVPFTSRLTVDNTLQCFLSACFGGCILDSITAVLL